MCDVQTGGLLITWLFIIDFKMCGFFFKQKTAYGMRISDWSSDVCSSDLLGFLAPLIAAGIPGHIGRGAAHVESDQTAKTRGLGGFHHAHDAAGRPRQHRSEGRRVGIECVRPGSTRLAPYH